VEFVSYWKIKLFREISVESEAESANHADGPHRLVGSPALTFLHN